VHNRTARSVTVGTTVRRATSGFPRAVTRWPAWTRRSSRRRCGHPTT